MVVVPLTECFHSNFPQLEEENNFSIHNWFLRLDLIRILNRISTIVLSEEKMIASGLV